MIKAALFFAFALCAASAVLMVVTVTAALNGRPGAIALLVVQFMCFGVCVACAMTLRSLLPEDHG